VRDETILIHGHEFYDERYGVFIPPIYLSAIYEQKISSKLTDRATELKYSREENINARALEKILAKLEKGVDALVFNSGMAAISTLLMRLVNKDTKLLLSQEMYGTSITISEILENKIGIKKILEFPETNNIIEAIITHKPNIVFIETITNPTLKVFDIESIGKVCKEYNCKLIVDNTFATPILINPLTYGANYVIHSLTKYIAGHNDVIAGAIIFDSIEEVIETWEWRRIMGTILSPFEAYLSIRGAKTLKIRFIKSSESARAIAEYLHDHPKIERVYYPGLPDSPYRSIAEKLFKEKIFGGVVSFVVRGGRESVRKIFNKLNIIRPSPSLGGTESLLTYPIVSASKNIPADIREKIGIVEGLLRLSVGLEDVNDLIEDLDQALREI
jgi:cystathionine gamma-synthase